MDWPRVPQRVLAILLVRPERYARVAFSPGGWLDGIGSLLLAYAFLGLEALPGLGGEIGDVPRFVLFGVVRAVLLSAILWAIGTQFHQRRVSFWAVMWVVSAAHLPLLAGIVVPGVVGTVVSLLWFVAALGAAARAVLDLNRRAAATTGSLAVCGLLIVMAATPVDLTGVPQI